MNSLDLNKSSDTENTSFFPISFKGGMISNLKHQQNFGDLNSSKSGTKVGNMNGRIKNNS